jgi:hypothetical protein
MMADPSRLPLPHEQAAARVVEDYLKRIEQPPPRRDLHREFAERLDRCRQYDQSKMPPWRDPRGG